jgi:protein TonB
MKVKKNPEVDLRRNTSLFFAVGLNLMLFLTWAALNMKSYDKADIVINVLDVESLTEEDIPIVNINTPPPPPPPQVASEVITIVEDVADIEETVIKSTEINMDDVIEEQVVTVEEVEVEKVEEDISVPFAVVEKVPIFPGCKGTNNDELKACFEKKVIEHVTKNFKFPELAMELGINGKVFVLFSIDQQGNVSGIRTRGPDKILEEEAARIIGLLPKMTPAKQRGKAVRVPYSIPIHFKLVEN